MRSATPRDAAQQGRAALRTARGGSRRFYRRWKGEGDPLGPNEALCPVCKIVVRSTRELRPGDRIYCMACMTRLVIARSAAGHEARVVY